MFVHTGVATLSMVVCDDARIAVLNAQHRGKDGPTDVLSFEMDDDLDYKVSWCWELLKCSHLSHQFYPKKGSGGIAWSTLRSERSSSEGPMKPRHIYLYRKGQFSLLLPPNLE